MKNRNAFEFLLCDFTLLHFAFFVWRHWQPGQSKNPPTLFLPRDSHYENKPNDINIVVLLDFRFFKQLLTPQWELYGRSLTGHLSNSHLSCLPGHLFSQTGHLYPLLEQTERRQGALIWLCGLKNDSQNKMFTLEVTQVGSVIVHICEIWCFRFNRYSQMVHNYYSM